MTELTEYVLIDILPNDEPMTRKGSVKTQGATLLTRANGYQHGREPNVTPESWTRN